MDIIKIVMTALVLVILIMILKNTRPEYALLIEIAGGIMLFFLIASKLTLLVNTMEELCNKINFNGLYLKILLKVVGITYIAEFGMNICKDAGRSAIAFKIELGAKVLILIVALPILDTLLEKIGLLLQ